MFHRLFLLATLLSASAILAEDPPRDRGWTLEGPIPEAPKRTTDRLPLSDQANTANWQPLPAFTDEFNGDFLDKEKWHHGVDGYLGHKPGFFWDANVAVGDGCLRLTMKKEEAPNAPREQSYHTYTTAAVDSNSRVLYGYFETRAKPMASAGSSGFWFHHDEAPWLTEIDVFEIGGRAKGFERKYNMNVHVFRTPLEKRHWYISAIWLANFDLADDFHVYGLEWTETELLYYVDGHLVHRIGNTHWHQHLLVSFDCETMLEWMGVPEDKDLPSTFLIDYLRAWKRP